MIEAVLDNSLEKNLELAHQGIAKAFETYPPVSSDTRVTDGKVFIVSCQLQMNGSFPLYVSGGVKTLRSAKSRRNLAHH